MNKHPLFSDRGFEARVIEATRAHHGGEIHTLQLRYPRFIHSEFMTHRAFSRNAASSRAIPVEKMISQVRNDPAMPIHWGKNQPGMQALVGLIGDAQRVCEQVWRASARSATDDARWLNNVGLHKQVANRILEPFQWMVTLVTSTEWDNFFELRDHPDAQPEMQLLAQLMRNAISSADPVVGIADPDCETWHLPYVSEDERIINQFLPTYLAKLSAARCARVSYLRHDGELPSAEDDLALFYRLTMHRPIHASPMEHQARAMTSADDKCRNFRGWYQFRAMLEPGVES